MLLILIFFYFFYGFSECDKIDTAKFNESILVAHHHQNLLEINTVLKDVQQKIHNMSLKEEETDNLERRQNKEVDYDNIRDSQRTKTLGKDQIYRKAKAYKRKLAKFHPLAQYDPLPTISDRHQGLGNWYPRFPPGVNVPEPSFVLNQPSSGYHMAIVPFNPGHRLGPPGFLLRPMRPRPNPPSLHPNYLYENVYLRPSGPNMQRPLFEPEPFNRSAFDTEMNSFIQKFPQIFNPRRPNLSRPVPNPAVSETSKLVTLSPSIRPMTGKAANIWLQGPYGLYIPVIDKWRNAETYQSQTLSSKGTVSTSTVSPTNRMTKISDYQHVTGATDAAQLFMQDEHGPLYLNYPEKGETPQPIPQFSKNFDSTTAGDVFYGKIKVRDPLPQPPTQRYQALMEQLNEGYMLVFMIELCRLVAVKDRKEVQQVLHHTETIYNQLWNNGRLAWIDDPFQTVIWKLAVTGSEGDIDVVRTYASMMFHMLLRRRQTLSTEVNTILDEADMFYKNNEGEQLFNALKEFETYPNTTKSSYWICNGLIETFLRPFRRQYRWSRRQKLLDKINAALNTRFPLLLKRHSAGKHKIGQPRKRKRKRHRFRYKMMRKRKRHSTPEYLNENTYGRQGNTDMDFGNSILRSTTLMTSERAEFRAIPSNRSRIKKKPRTTVKLSYRSNRIYSFNKRNKKLSYQLQATSPYQRKLDDLFIKDDHKSTKKTDIHHHNIGRKTATTERRPTPRDFKLNESRSPNRIKRARKHKTHFL